MVTRLDPADLRSYARRDWGAPERLARAERARLPIAKKVKLAVMLYEAYRRALPDWPDENTRRTDFKAHLKLKALLDRAPNVSSR